MSSSPLLPFSPEITTAVGLVLLAVAVCKTTCRGGPVGAAVFYVLTAVEVGCGVALSVSMLASLDSLRFAHSRLMYVLAVVTEWVFLLLDVSASVMLLTIKRREMRSNTDRRLLPSLASAAGMVLLGAVVVVFFLPTVALMAGMYGRLGWVGSAAAVTDLTASESEISGSYWRCFTGFGLLLLAGTITLSGVIFTQLRVRQDDAAATSTAGRHLLLPIIFGGALGAPLIASAGLTSGRPFAPGYALVAMIAVPPLLAYLVSSSKLFAMHQYARSTVRAPRANQELTQVKVDEAAGSA